MFQRFRLDSILISQWKCKCSAFFSCGHVVPWNLHFSVAHRTTHRVQSCSSPITGQAKHAFRYVSVTLSQSSFHSSLTFGIAIDAFASALVWIACSHCCNWNERFRLGWYHVPFLSIPYFTTQTWVPHKFPKIYAQSHSALSQFVQELGWLCGRAPQVLHGNATPSPRTFQELWAVLICSDTSFCRSKLSKLSKSFRR